MKKASDLYSVDRKTISKWRDSKRKLIDSSNENGGSKKIKLEGRGRKLLFPLIEDQLNKWIIDQRLSKQPISRPIIKAQAQLFFREDPQNHDKSYEYGERWIERFLVKNKISLRVIIVQEDNANKTEKKNDLDFEKQVLNNLHVFSYF